jgi:polysaccharide chain length determinant protein (PEP-CTERM system associated)
VNGIYDEALVALHGVWQRRWLALGIGWAIALVGWAAISMIASRYESTARILIQSQSLLPDTVGITAADRQKAVESVRTTLTAQSNLEKVVRSTDLGRGIKSDAAVAGAAAALSKNIKIVAQADNLFEISASDRRPRIARQIVAKLIALFVDGNLSDGRVETSAAIRFLDVSINSRSQQLAAADAKRAQFQSKYMTALPGIGPIDQRLDAARAEVARIEGDLAAAQSGLSAINGQMGGVAPLIRTPGVLVGGSAGDGRAAAIRGQMAEGAARGWTDQHPDMVALRDQLSRTPSSSGTAPRLSGGSSTPNPMYMTLRSQQAEKQAVASALAARKAALQGQINQVVSVQASNPEMAAEQTEVDRNYSVLKSQYDKLLADREDLRLRGQAQSQTDAVKFSVIDPPSAPSVPAAPNRPVLLTLVLIVAVAGGTGAAFALGQLRKTYSTASRLASASGLAVLGSIGEVVTGAERAVRQKKQRLFYGGSAALAGLYALLLVAEFVQRGLVA